MLEIAYRAVLVVKDQFCDAYVVPESSTPAIQAALQDEHLDLTPRPIRTRTGRIAKARRDSSYVYMF